MLNLKKVILGLGLLGVVSYANAAYLKCGTENVITKKFTTTVTSLNTATMNDVFTALEDGALLKDDSVTGTYVPIAAKTSYSVYSTLYFKAIGESFGGCTVMAGNIPNSTSAYDDTSLKNEDALMKARIQALEAKVYQCVQ